MLIGFGAFNVIEGVVDHHLLVIHRVNATVPVKQRIWWDIYGVCLFGAQRCSSADGSFIPLLIVLGFLAHGQVLDPRVTYVKIRQYANSELSIQLNIRQEPPSH
jgi:hypothetical protein